MNDQRALLRSRPRATGHFQFDLEAYVAARLQECRHRGN